MLKMSDSSAQFLQKYLPAALNTDSISDALDLLYDLIMKEGFAPPHYLDYNDFGDAAQKVYDDLYYRNCCN